MERKFGIALYDYRKADGSLSYKFSAVNEGIPDAEILIWLRTYAQLIENGLELNAKAEILDFFDKK